MEGDETVGFREKLESLNTRRIIFWIIMIAALFFLVHIATAAFLVLLALGTAIFVNFFNFRWTGIEFTTLAVILIGMAFGPKAGGIVGFVLICLQLLFGQYVGAYVFWVVPGYTVAGVLAGLIGISDVAMVGMYITIGLHVVFTLFTAIFSTGRLVKYLPYAGLNIVFNIILFSLFGPILLGYMV